MVSGQQEVAQQKEALDARIQEAAVAAERAARLPPPQCKEKVQGLARLLREEASRWGLAPASRRQSRDIHMALMTNEEILAMELGALEAELHEAIAAAKRLNLAARSNSLADQLDLEAMAMAESQGGAESGEGISAFLEKRRADFTKFRK